MKLNEAREQLLQMTKHILKGHTVYFEHRTLERPEYVGGRHWAKGATVLMIDDKATEVAFCSVKDEFIPQIGEIIVMRRHLQKYLKERGATFRLAFKVWRDEHEKNYEEYQKKEVPDIT